MPQEFSALRIHGTEVDAGAIHQQTYARQERTEMSLGAADKSICATELARHLRQSIKPTHASTR
jgi:hypothetical protein